ncbi:MAG: tetratricopeptide repeat protein [Chloroflexi bacterium]|nr:tetratricopeptide repeat protein [Chloroflexota bacterium]
MSSQTNLVDYAIQTAAYFDMLGHPAYAIQVLENVLATQPSHENVAQKAALLAELSGSVWKNGGMEQALNMLQHAAELMVSSTDDQTLANVYYQLGELSYIQAVAIGGYELNQSLDLHQKALDLRGKVGNKMMIADSLSRLGVIQQKMGNDQCALDLFDEAIEISDKVGYWRGKTRPLTHKGVFHRKNGELETALEYFEKALAINQKMGCQERLLFNLVNVSTTRFQIDGIHEPAILKGIRALEIAELLDFKLAIINVLLFLGDMDIASGDEVQARADFMRADSEARAVGYHIFEKVAQRKQESIEKSETQ